MDKKKPHSVLVGPMGPIQGDIETLTCGITRKLFKKISELDTPSSLFFLLNGKRASIIDVGTAPVFKACQKCRQDFVVFLIF
jgi:hypothetical protein